MIDLLRAIVARLESRSYANEAAVREGIVVPILRELGWDTHDPDEVRPEHPNPAGRVDYALLHRGRRPAVLVEVKAVGRSLEGDRQLFRYCFEEGVPLAVLTDGRSWNFYLPAGVGRLDERRVHSLEFTERSPEGAAEVLARYLARSRVLDGTAFTAAREDHEKAFNSREAIAALPAAWEALIAEANELLVEELQQKVEAMSGYRPPDDRTLAFLEQLGEAGSTRPHAPARRTDSPDPVGPDGEKAGTSGEALLPAKRPAVPVRSLAIDYTVFGERRSATNASEALVDILRTIVRRDVSRIPELSDRLVTRTRRHIGRTPQEIYPARPHSARCEEIAPGWLVGLNIDNRDKRTIIEEACALYGIAVPEELDVKLPNS